MSRYPRTCLLSSLALALALLPMQPRAEQSAQKLREQGLTALALEACGAIFISGLPPAEFLSRSSMFWLTQSDRAQVLPPVVDRDNKRVSVRIGDTVRTAEHSHEGGCFPVPSSGTARRAPTVRPTRSQPIDWNTSREGLSRGLTKRLDRAVDSVFAHERAQTAAVLIVLGDKLVVERYGDGIGAATPLAGWSMTKTVQAALTGVLVQQGRIKLRDPVPVEQWRNDTRRDIRWLDLLRMSSGLQCSDGRGYDEARWRMEGYPDHLAGFAQPDAFAWAISRPAESRAGSIGRYRNCDALALGAALDTVLKQHGHDLATWPSKGLYERIGVTSMQVSSDASGNPLFAGFGYATARDWARFGRLFLQDGVWNGERLLDMDFMDMLRAPAPAWVGAGDPQYAGQVWLAGARMRSSSIPADTFALLGIDGQAMWIVPSRDLIVLRLGFGGGGQPGKPPAFSEIEQSFLQEIIDSVPEKVTSAEHAAVRATLSGYFAALEQSDRAAAARLVTRDFLLYDAGEIMTNDVLFARLAPARKEFTAWRWILSNMHVRTSGDTATVRYRNEAWRQAADGRIQTPQWLESAHLVREPDGWKLQFLHSSRKH